MDDKPIIQIRNVRPATNGPGAQIKFSRNVIAFLQGLSAIQINAIIGIEDALQKSLYFGRICPNYQLVDEDIAVTIPYSIISGCHDTGRIEEELVELLSVQIKYSRSIPGYDINVTSTIVSSVIRINGQFHLGIPSASLPFYLFCGSNVGFATIERDIFLHLPSRNQKLLHLLLAEKIDAKTNTGALAITPEDFLRELHLSQTYTTSALLKNVLEPYINRINNSNSSYSLALKKLTDKCGRRGQPRITTIIINAAKRKDDNDMGNLFSNVYRFLADKWQSLDSPMMSAIQVTERLHAYSSLDEFSLKMNRFMTKEREKGTENRRHTANAIRKVLKDDFQIKV